MVEPINLVNMNDMAQKPKDSDLDMYADDSTLGIVGDTIEILNYKLCADMVQIGEWCTENKIRSQTQIKLKP